MDNVNAILRRIPAWPIYLMGLAGIGWLFYVAAVNPPTAEPIDWLTDEYGELGFQLILLGLAITPLRTHLGLNLIKFRRAIGVIAFAFIFAHFLVWAVLDLQSLSAIGTEIVKRPYITVGFSAFVLMIPLAVTSNNWSVRKLGPNWRKLHKLTYPVVILASLHFIWLTKGNEAEPYVYLLIALVLLGLRLTPKRRAVRA